MQKFGLALAVAVGQRRLRSFNHHSPRTTRYLLCQFGPNRESRSEKTAPTWNRYTPYPTIAVLFYERAPGPDQKQFSNPNLIYGVGGARHRIYTIDFRLWNVDVLPIGLGYALEYGAN